MVGGYNVATLSWAGLGLPWDRDSTAQGKIWSRDHMKLVTSHFYHWHKELRKCWQEPSSPAHTLGYWQEPSSPAHTQAIKRARNSMTA